ncbi:MAG: DMT family transporter [Desulfobacteraceae bacterium]|nr:MAG: DMT family transporter [Desulfobacteraceae bacterium]
MAKPTDTLEISKEMSLNASIFSALLCMMFGGNAVAIKISMFGLGAFTAAGIRFSIAAAVIYAWARFKRINLGINTRQCVQLLIIGTAFFIQMLCFYFGLERTSASHGVLILNIQPFIVMVLAHFFIPGDQITLKKTCGIALGFSGILVLFFNPGTFESHLNSGDLIVLSAVLLWGTSTVYIKRIINDFHAIQITWYPMVMGLPFFFLGGFLFDQSMVKQITGNVIQAMFYQSVVTASFGFLAWNTLLQKYGATALHSFLFLMPVTGVIFGVLLLNEPVSINLILSLLLIACGILLVNFKYERPFQSKW